MIVRKSITFEHGFRAPRGLHFRPIPGTPFNDNFGPTYDLIVDAETPAAAIDALIELRHLIDNAIIEARHAAEAIT